MNVCPLPDDFVTPALNRVLTQYRESPKLLHMIRVFVQQVEQAAIDICSIPSFFEIDTAVGDQLTLLGKRLGWPRCHCICTAQPVFGFTCEGYTSEVPLVGFCEGGTWLNCGEFGIGEVCITDDEMYRNFLRVRRYQMLTLFDYQSLQNAIQVFYGPTARILDAGHGRIVIAPGRPLNDQENAFLQLIPRVLPVAPGIDVRFHFGEDLRVFGFGTGWGGFCEEWAPDGLALSAGGNNAIGTENNFAIGTGPLTRGAPWMCEIDVQPYACVT